MQLKSEICFETFLNGRPVIIFFVWYPGAESNCYLKFRKLLFYPLNYRGNPCFAAPSAPVAVCKVNA